MTTTEYAIDAFQDMARAYADPELSDEKKAFIIYEIAVLISKENPKRKINRLFNRLEKLGLPEPNPLYNIIPATISLIAIIISIVAIITK